MTAPLSRSDVELFERLLLGRLTPAEYEHIKTGLHLSGTMRMVIVVTNGLITRVDCYHDGERISAFMRMLRAR